MTTYLLNVTEQSQKEINWRKLDNLIREKLSIQTSSEMVVTQFNAGYSNLTYLLSFGNTEVVLRRPPFGYIPPKAHDMEREYRILSKINPSFPLVPKPLLYDIDTEIMDKHFYIMEKKMGLF